MFEHFVKRPFHLRRHQKGPFAEERRRYLEHLFEEGRSFYTLHHATGLLLSIALLLPPDRGLIRMGQIEAAAERWLVSPPRQFRSDHSRHKAKRTFIFYAKGWLRFLGRLDQRTKPVPFQSELDAFLHFQEHERCLSLSTVLRRRRTVRAFLTWLVGRKKPLREATADDVSLFFRFRSPGRWQRSTIALYVDSLRSFFRFAESKNWCIPGVAAAIDAPIVYRHEHLPRGPQWDDVIRLLSPSDKPAPVDIRDRAMLLLHAVYGFRNTEVRLLRVDDIDWQEEIISLSRPKQRKSQLYPLLPEIGDAILQYLREVRPKTRRREVFLSLKQPYRPLTASATYSNVARRQRTLGLALPHYGPHSLRHACATRLLAQGFSLKEIGDHLGHSSTDATQIYAKVDLPALREVAELDLGNLVNFASRSMPDDAAPQNPSAGGQR